MIDDVSVTNNIGPRANPVVDDSRWLWCAGLARYPAEASLPLTTSRDKLGVHANVKAARGCAWAT